MALCVTLLPGGLLAISAVGYHRHDSAAHVREEVAANPEVLLPLMFMAGIYFMKQLLLLIFTRLLPVSARRWFCRWPLRRRCILVSAS